MGVRARMTPTELRKLLREHRLRVVRVSPGREHIPSGDRAIEEMCHLIRRSDVQ